MLQLDGIHAGYSAVKVLHGVSIAVEAGAFVSMVGPNGAGKTTLFKTISGIVVPSAGRIEFEGVDLLRIAPAKRAHLGIAHVPEGRQVFPSLTVMENLEMGAYTEAGRRDWQRNIERIFAWLPVLTERRGQLAGTLSGGEQQMLAIGRGLASSPKLLMLDDPSMGLARRSPTSSSSACWRSARMRASPSFWSSRGSPRRWSRPTTATCSRPGAWCWKGRPRRCAPTIASARPISACNSRIRAGKPREQNR